MSAARADGGGSMTRWSGVASMVVAVVWLLLFASVGLWEVRSAKPLSLRGGQAGLAHPWSGAVLVFGFPVALLLALSCTVVAAWNWSANGGRTRLRMALVAIGLLVIGAVALYFGLGFIA